MSGFTNLIGTKYFSKTLILISESMISFFYFEESHSRCCHLFFALDRAFVRHSFFASCFYKIPKLFYGIFLQLVFCTLAFDSASLLSSCEMGLNSSHVPRVGL